MDSPPSYPHAALAEASEAVARGWALLVAVATTFLLPVVHLTRDYDEYVEEVSNPASLLSTIPRVIFRPLDDFQRVEPGNLGTKLVLLRLTLLLTMVLLGLATYVAVRWLTTGTHDGAPAWLRVITATGLAGCAVLTALLCGEIGSPDSQEGLELGIDAGAGLLSLLVCAAVLLAPQVAHRWDVAQRHA